MEKENVFLRLRKEKTIGTWKEPYTQYKLAKELGIKQQTVAKAENGFTPSYNTVKKYHDHFNVPYNTLFGDGTALEEKNTDISKELNLSDNAIENIRKLSPYALSLLDAFLSHELAGMKLESNYNTLKRISCIKLTEKNLVVAEHELHAEKYLISESITSFLINEILPKL